LDSTLPIISKAEDVKVGTVTHAVVSRTSEKHIVVEFYNNIKATIPHRETGYVTRAI
jgi:rRNA biogenesis protein RRP5